MINLYYRHYPISHGISRSPSWDNLVDKYRGDLTNVLGKYRSMEKRVYSNHILSRIIKHMDIDVTKNIYDYMTILDSTVLYTIKNFNVSTNITTGKITSDKILSTGDTLLLSADLVKDYFSLEDTWMNYMSIRPVYYTGIGLQMNHPTNIGEELDLSIFEIDVKLLMIQYKYWALKRIELGYDVDPSTFVYTVVLTNMIPELLDLSILNRFYKIGEELEEIDSTHNFHTRHNDRILDMELSKLKKRLIKRGMYYEEYLHSIPLVTNKDAYTLMRMFPKALNSNTLWSNYLARANYTLLMIETLGKNGIRKNYNHLKDLDKILKRLKTSNKLYDINLGDNDIDILYDYERLIDIVRDRSL